MVILVKYIENGDLHSLSSIVLLLKERMHSINWYHLNFDADAMFKLLCDEQKNRPEYNLPHLLMSLLPVYYKKQDQNTKHSIAMNKKTITHHLMLFKKWFDNEQSLDSTITNLFNQFDPDDVNNSNSTTHIHFRINSDSFVKYIDINVSDVDNFDDVFSKIELA